jgi:hypothetical protein
MIKELRPWVQLKLTYFPNLRDSNEQLYYIYLTELGYDTTKSLKNFLKDMEARRIPYLDSIARASRKVQEEHPHLRGKYWKKRKKKSIEVKQEMREK